MDKINKLGKTGDFPDGKINKHDEGSLVFGVACDFKSGNVIVNFGTPVAWMGLPPEHAKAFALQLIADAEKIEKGKNHD